MKLLIAEDNAFFRNILKQVLAPEYELIFAHNGDEAWDKLQRPDAPQLAILDWVMPGLSGPQVCRNVRACHRTSNTYLILFTARNSMADVISGFRAGADDYVTKPFDPEELRTRVKLGKLVLDLQDAAELRELLAKEERECLAAFPQQVAGWPFSLRPSGDEHLYRVEDCLIGPLPPSSLPSPAFLQADAATLLQPQYFLENLHA
jgi:CheY-like chemotaxis protein